MIKKEIFIVLILLISSGCRVGPEYRYPEPVTPAEWKGEDNSTTNRLVENWWEIFDDDMLDHLETQAVTNNYNLYAAIERVAEARAYAGIVEAALWPQITLNPNYLNEGILEMLYGPGVIGLKDPTIREHQRTNAIITNLSYEVDLWGKLRSAYDQAVYEEEAQEEDLRTTLLMLTTDLAYAYYQLRAYDSQLDILEATIKAYKKALDINQFRYDAKIVNYSDVSRAQTELTNAEASLNEVQRMRDLQEHIIAVLVAVPASDFCLPHMPLKGLPPIVPAGLPSDVLLQRPDIAEAEREIAAANAEVRVAYAMFFPSLTLTGGLGFSSPDLKQFLKWKSRFWMMGATAMETLFDGGRLKSNLYLTIAEFREALDDYQEVVLEAFQEVEDALSNIEEYNKEYDNITQSVTSSKKTYTISYDRYIQGVTFYLDVVDAERDVLQAELQQAQLLGSQYYASVQLIKALGGSWRVPAPEDSENGDEDENCDDQND
jgi:multidrug efflux system outer membrane protein